MYKVLNIIRLLIKRRI